MKVLTIKMKQAEEAFMATDCFVGKGLVRDGHSSLPDIDVDYQSDRRQEMKEYLEERYNINGKQRVFSAGTFTTLKLKAVLKDVCRVHKVPISLVNFITKMLPDDGDWTTLFKLAFQYKETKEKKNQIYKFITKYPRVIEDIRALMGQPKSTSIHASAIIVTPEKKDGEDVECFDYLPIRKMDGVLVSEFDGYSVDELGLLKEDVLATKELSKLNETIQSINKEYGEKLSISEIIKDENLKDEKTYKLLSEGYTQNVFQFSSEGITKFITEVRPDNIEDLVAINALYRPATLEIKATDDYVRYKHGEATPVYNYGTYEATKETYGIFCIAKGSPVVTSEGLKPIEEIQMEDMVLTEDGTYHPVLLKTNNGERPIIKIRSSFGQELSCTPDHQILTQYGWVCAKDLIPSKHLIKCFWAVEENKNIGTMKDWCLGIYLANGSKSVPHSIACRSKVDAEKISEIFNREFDLQSTVEFRLRCWYVILTTLHGRTNGKFSANYIPNKFNQWLRDLGLDKCNVYNKFIPIKPSLHLLSGLIEGDGCLQNNTVRLRNPTLAKQLFLGLQSHRIYSNYYQSHETNIGIIDVVRFSDVNNKLPLYIKTRVPVKRANSNGPSVPSQYIATIDLSKCPQKCRSNLYNTFRHAHFVKLNTIINYNGTCEHDIWGKVLKVSQDNVVKKEVYDLSVETNHSFCVGGIIVKNCYQESFMSIAHTLGGFDLGKTDLLRKAIGKKKADLMASLKNQFISGAIANGCPDYEAEEIWHKIELAGKYSFNKSHAAAYALTAYCGAWLKANFPTAFYSIALKWANEDELPAIMSEMELISDVKIMHPDINRSETDLFTDYNRNYIFWPLTRVKFLGTAGVNWIVEERTKNGPFTSVTNFIHRVFKYKLKKYAYWDDPDNEEEAQRCPVNARHVRNLIISGCFDEVSEIKDITRRYALLEVAAEELGFHLNDEELPANLIDKPYFWSMKQIETSGVGAVDYKRLFNTFDDRKNISRVAYMELQNAAELYNEGKRIAVCALVIDTKEISFTDKKSGERKSMFKINLQQNNELMELVIWDETFREYSEILRGCKGKIIIATCLIRFSEYTGKNGLQSFNKSQIFVL